MCNNVLIANGTVAQFSTGIYLHGNSNTVASMIVKQSTGADGETPNIGSGIVLQTNGFDAGRQTVTTVTNRLSISNFFDRNY